MRWLTCVALVSLVLLVPALVLCARSFYLSDRWLWRSELWSRGSRQWTSDLEVERRPGCTVVEPVGWGRIGVSGRWQEGWQRKTTMSHVAHRRGWKSGNRSNWFPRCNYRKEVDAKAGLEAEFGSIIIPDYLPALLLGAIPILWLRRYRQEKKVRMRVALDTCPVCGYDVRATPDRCSECGAPVRRAGRAEGNI